MASPGPHADPAVLERLVAEWAPRGVRSIDLPKAELPVWQAYFANGERAYFGPDDGTLLLRRGPDNDVLMWLHEWHVGPRHGQAGTRHYRLDLAGAALERFVPVVAQAWALAIALEGTRTAPGAKVGDLAPQ